jgi:transcriptional regulator with XRE-family HTH domain
VNPNQVVRLAVARQFSLSGEGRVIRCRAGLSLSEIAAAVGRSPVTIFRWERAERTPTGAQAVAWADLLDQLEAVARTVRDLK